MIRVTDLLADQQILRAPTPPGGPLVSVIFPTYHRANGGGLDRAIRSVLSQSLDDFELLIMDDGSIDGSFEIIEALRAVDARVVHVRHEMNCGLTGLRVNEGIELARGKYLAFQLDSHSWRPRALETLVSEADCHEEPTVVIGRSSATGHTPELMMPLLEVSVENLMLTNIVANNSVLLPRCLLDEHGMFDCHIAMRCYYDWDLWLRLIKHVPFVAIEEVVSDIVSEQSDSVMPTSFDNLAVFRCFQAINRNSQLTPGRWRDYEIDSLRVGGVTIRSEFRKRIYEQHIVPYYLRSRHRLSTIEGFPTSLPLPCWSVLYTRPNYDATNEIALNQYDALANRRGTYKASFQYLAQLQPSWIREVDAALLVRPHRDDELAVMEQGLARGLPMGIYLDDDFVTLHEYGPPFDFMAPGTPNRRSLLAMLEGTDTVWVTSRFIAESVQPINPRIVPHGLAIAEDCLPADTPRRRPSEPLRIGYVGTSYRVEEFRILWQALVRLSVEYGDRLQFEFWGLDVSTLPPLSSPVRQVPYETSYSRFLHRLRQARFDILLTPLLDQPRPRLAKNAHKYFYAAVAGALGIFSRVPPYERLPEALTCLKADNTAADWYAALREAVDMPPARFDRMRQRTLAHVREEFTPAAQIHLHEAAWRATEFHAKTRTARHADGRPRVVYALGGLDWETQIRLSRWLRLVRQYGIEPVVLLRAGLAATAGRRLAEGLAADHIACEFAAFRARDDQLREVGAPGDDERRDLDAVLDRWTPALVHTIGLIPVLGEVCAARGVAHIASLYAVPDDTRWPIALGPSRHCALNHSDTLRYATRWSEWLGTEKFCAREVVAQDSFDLGLRRSLEALGTEAAPAASRVRIVVAGTLREDGGQLEAIAAVAELVQAGHAGPQCALELWGDTELDPEYVRRCREQIAAAGLGPQVRIHSAPSDLLSLVAAADIVLSPDRMGSLPLAIKEAMAVGALVVATPVGGVPELIIDDVSGLLCADASAAAIAAALLRAIQLPAGERHRLVEQARRVARSELHPQRAASDLLEMYNRTIDVTRGTRAIPPVAPARTGVPTHPGPRERFDQPAPPRPAPFACTAPSPTDLCPAARIGAAWTCSSAPITRAPGATAS